MSCMPVACPGPVLCHGCALLALPWCGRGWEGGGGVWGGGGGGGGGGGLQTESEALKKEKEKKATHHHCWRWDVAMEREGGWWALWSCCAALGYVTRCLYHTLVLCCATVTRCWHHHGV